MSLLDLSPDAPQTVPGPRGPFVDDLGRQILAAPNRPRTSYPPLNPHRLPVTGRCTQPPDKEAQ